MVSVPYCRQVAHGARGDDVVAYKRALSRWNPHAYPWTTFTDFAGPYFWPALLEFKRQHGLGAVPMIGKVTHDALARAVCHYDHLGEQAFDAEAVRLMTGFCHSYGKTPEQLVREAIVAEAFWLYGNRSHIAYSKRRPIDMERPPRLPGGIDCSGFVTLSWRVGGGNDPNGLGFNGQGYTGTLIRHGLLVHRVEDLRIADLIFYYFSSGGPGFRVGDPTHVAMYVGKVNGIESVLSMGSYPMSLYPYNFAPINQLRTYPVF